MRNLFRNRSILAILCLLLIAVMMLTLTACGGGNDETQDDGTQPDNGTTQEPGDDTGTETDPGTSDGNSEGSVSQAQLSELFQSGLELTEYAYRLEMVTEFETNVARLWIKGSNMKIENEQDGIKYAMIVGTTYSYTLDPVSMTAMGVTWEEGEVDENGDSQDINNFVSHVEHDAFDYLGQEDIHGEPCYIVESVDLVSNASVKLWIHKEYGIAMRAEFTGAIPEESMYMEISELQIGNIPDSTFEVPSDYEIISWDDLFDIPEEITE